MSRLSPSQRSSRESAAVSNAARPGGSKKAHTIGAQTGRWAESILQQRGIQALRIVIGLVSLAKHHRDAEIEQSCRIAHFHAAWRLRDMAALRLFGLLAHHAAQSPGLMSPVAALDMLNRPLSPTPVPLFGAAGSVLHVHVLLACKLVVQVSNAAGRVV